MAYIDTDAMKAAIAARQSQASASTNATHWDTLAAEVVTSGYNAIVGALSGRGFTAAQIASWDRGAEYNRRVGYCHFLRELAASGDYDAAAIDRQCGCEEELETVPVTISGEVVEPAGSDTRISTGDFDTSDDIHTIDDTL